MTALDDEIRTLRARIEELEAADAERDRAERVQAALYRIAETASAAQDMGAFYAEMHRIVGELMYADNFYIVLYDEERQTMNWPFYVDTVGEGWPDPNVWVPMGTGDARGITAYLLRTGIPLLLDFAGIDDLVRRGEVDMIGVPSVTWLGVPLRSEGRIVGAMVVQSFLDDIRHSERDRELLTFVASHVGAALSRARAIEETRQRNAELALINDVQRGLAMNLDMQSMYDLVGDRIQEIFDAQVVDIAILDASSGMLNFAYTIERGVRFHDDPIEVMGWRRVVLETREPLVVNEDIKARSLEVGQPFVISGEPAKSVLFVPLVVGDRATGVISLQNLDREHAFGEADVRLLTTLAGSLSIGLENARLFEETRQRAAELAIVNNVGQALADQLELDALIERLGDQLREVFAADLVYVALHDRATDMIEFAYYSEGGERRANAPFRYGEGLTSKILQTRQPMLLNRTEAFEEVAVPVMGTPARSYLGVPIVAGTEAIGVISVQSIEKAGRFGA